MHENLGEAASRRKHKFSRHGNNTTCAPRWTGGCIIVLHALKTGALPPSAATSGSVSELIAVLDWARAELTKGEPPIPA